MNLVHLHLLLNHVPVIGAIFGFLLLGFAVLKNSNELKKASFGVFVIAALIAVPVYLTGEPTEELVENLPGISKPFIERHESAALIALIAIVAVGVTSAVGIVLFRGERKIPAWFSSLSLVLALAAGGALSWTANLGGQVRHSEIRAESTSKASELNEIEKPAEKQKADHDDR